jgi:enamine deaminase RidA (YjgF/YER057c/UK114 family)
VGAGPGRARDGFSPRGAASQVARVVNSTEDFTRLPDVRNGALDGPIQVFGEASRHARSAVGMQQLHYGMAIEMEGIVEIA